MKREMFFVYLDNDTEPLETDDYDLIEIGRFLNWSDQRGKHLIQTFDTEENVKTVIAIFPKWKYARMNKFPNQE